MILKTLNVQRQWIISNCKTRMQTFPHKDMDIIFSSHILCSCVNVVDEKDTLGKYKIWKVTRWLSRFEVVTIAPVYYSDMTRRRKYPNVFEIFWKTDRQAGALVEVPPVLKNDSHFPNAMSMQIFKMYNLLFLGD